MLHTGAVRVSSGRSQPCPMMLTLNIDSLTLQKELDEEATIEIDPKVRVVEIDKGEGRSLGVSVKGGREHNLPILISRLPEDKPAARSRKLFVGDAILRINGRSVLHDTHEEAVRLLKKTGPIVRLHVKHYEVASRFLRKSNMSRRTSDSSITTYLKSEDGWRTPTTPDSRSLNGFELEDCFSSERWMPVVQIPLLMAYITRYVRGSDRLRHNAFEVCGASGQNSGIIHCDDLLAMSQWTKHITNNITGLTNLQMKLFNRDLPSVEHIVYMGWVCEGYLNADQTCQDWMERFLALKGSELYIFDQPPREQQDWLKCQNVHSVYQAMFRKVRESENIDERQHCFLIQTTSGSSHYISVETRQELIRIESSWLQCVHQAVLRLGSKVFRVSCDGVSSDLTLDWSGGFALYDVETRLCCWKYKFSQLKSSSDDGQCRLRLDFLSADGTELHTREVDCEALQPLLFCMHAFLTAKVAAVDPSFLKHCSR